MEINVQEIISATIVLFAILDILGSLPIIVAMQSRGVEIKPLQTVVVAFVILIAFMYLGEALLGFFGVDLNSFAVAGAIVLFIIGLEMVIGKDIMKADDANTSASIVPLAFPLLAGPGTFTTVIALRAEYNSMNVIIGLVINMLIIYGVLQSSTKISRLIGENGAYVMKKFFGIILLAISVRLFTSNLSALLDVVGK